MNYLRDKTVIICATCVVVALMGGVVFLTETNHGNDASHYLSLLGTMILNLVGLFGMAVKVSQLGRTAQKAADTAQDTNDKIHNGHLVGKVKEGVKEALDQNEGVIVITPEAIEHAQKPDAGGA